MRALSFGGMVEEFKKGRGKAKGRKRAPGAGAGEELLGDGGDPEMAAAQTQVRALHSHAVL